MEPLTQYFALQEEIFAYFGYAQQEVEALPFDDQRAAYWLLLQEEGKPGKVLYSPTPLTKESIALGSETEVGYLIHRFHLPRLIWRGKDFTLIRTTWGRGDHVLMVVTNGHQHCSEELARHYRACWEGDGELPGAQRLFPWPIVRRQAP